MKLLKLFLFLTTLMVAGVALGQDGPPPQDVGDERRGRGRPNLFAELGLSPDQVRQIRQINQHRRPAMAEAQQRMREANRNLDLAIYGDTVSDAEFQTRLKEFQSAQADVGRLRFESELAIRKVLTAEQLVRFRELRRRFSEARGRGQERRRQRRVFRPGRGDDAPIKKPLNE